MKREVLFQGAELIRAGHRLEVPRARLTVRFGDDVWAMNPRDLPVSDGDGAWVDAAVEAPDQLSPFKEGELWDFRQRGHGVNLRLVAYRRNVPLGPVKAHRRLEEWKLLVYSFRSDEENWFPRPPLMREEVVDDFLGPLKAYLEDELGSLETARFTAEGGLRD